MRYITILNQREMAKELNIPKKTLEGYFNKANTNYDPSFPVIKMGGKDGCLRFVKEKVLQYLDYKKKTRFVESLKSYKKYHIRIGRNGLCKRLGIKPKQANLLTIGLSSTIYRNEVLYQIEDVINNIQIPVIEKPKEYKQSTTRFLTDEKNPY